MSRPASRSHLRRTLAAAAVVLCAATVALPASASASSATGVGRDLENPFAQGNDELVYFGAYGGANDHAHAADDLQVTQAAPGGSLTFTDWHHDMDAGPACTQLGTHQVRCNGANLTELRIHVFDGSNFVQADVQVHAVIDAGDQPDTLYGGSKQDRIDGGGGGDHIRGEGGIDSLHGDAGDDSITGGLGADLVDGGAGIDTAVYSQATGAVRVDLAHPGGDGQFGEGDNVQTENVTGGPYGDRLYGTGGANKLSGAGGADLLIGRGGNDHLLGGAGVDALLGGTGDDLLNGGAGADANSCGAGIDTVVADPQDTSTLGCE